MHEHLVQFTVSPEDINGISSHSAEVALAGEVILLNVLIHKLIEIERRIVCWF
jgi:hypothetical protein